MYKKIKRNILLENGKPIWNPILSKHINNEVHEGTFQYTHKEIESLPLAIKHLFYIWRAQCEIGGNGFTSLVYQGDGYEIKGIYDAFDFLNLDKLKKLMGLSIGMSLEEGQPEFLLQNQEEELLEWYNAFSIDSSPYADIESMDNEENTYELVKNDEIEQVINNFIMNNLDSISE